MRIRYSSQRLLEFSTELFVAAGLARERAVVMASVFVEADLLGFTTHGFNCVARNLGWLEDGVTRKDGEPIVLADRGNVFNWDAEFLPGPWVVTQAIEQCINRVGERGIVCATIRRSHHIACLGAYLPRIAEADNSLSFIETVSSTTENLSSADQSSGFLPSPGTTNPLALACLRQ